MSILKNLKKHNQKEKVSFHMPGHKNGNLFCGSDMGSNIWSLDTTELSDTDCLINPESFIKNAEEKAAQIYGAHKSYFLVNGATSGIIAMFIAAFNEGDKIIVLRDCHRSVINAMILSGVVPIYVETLIYEKGFSGGADIDKIKEAFKENPDARGIFITSPTYFGIVSDISQIAEIAHAHGAVLLCDEAHGAHFPFSDRFPQSAMKCGADISVVSLHKSMPCPNQTAILNLADCRVLPEDMRNAINMVQTTSPSYIFLSAMEYALNFGKNKGQRLTEDFLSYVTKSEYLFSFDDPFKLILDFSPKGYTGFEISEILERVFGIYSELATINVVLLMASWGNTRKDFVHLEKAIKYISNLPEKEKIGYNESSLVKSECVKTPKEVFQGDKIKVMPNEAIGRIAAREVTIFPPCIPVFMPGESICREHIEIITDAQKSNLTIMGMEERYILVAKDQ